MSLADICAAMTFRKIILQLFDWNGNERGQRFLPVGCKNWPHNPDTWSRWTSSNVVFYWPERVLICPLSNKPRLQPHGPLSISPGSWSLDYQHWKYHTAGLSHRLLSFKRGISLETFNLPSNLIPKVDVPKLLFNLRCLGFLKILFGHLETGMI